MRIIVYYRIRSTDPGASAQVLHAQLAAARAWVDERGAEIVGHHIEEEGGHPDRITARPALAAAVCACKSHGATLLVASTEPIGSGHHFEPRITSVPVEVIRVAPKLPALSIDLPEGGPDRPCLRLHRLRGRGGNHIPVYFCNPGPQALADVVVASVGRLRESGLTLETSQSEKSLGTVEPCSCVLIEVYDLVFDGDFVDFYGFEFEFEFADGARCRGKASIARGGPKHDRMAINPE